jgi:subtilisin family serine protease
MKPYIVTLRKDVDYTQFWQEIENPSTGLEFIPDRAVPIHHDQPYLNRNCTYELTDTEAEHLRKDSRVQGVDDPSQISAISEIIQTGNNFNKLTNPGKEITRNPYDFIPLDPKTANWALERCNSPVNNYKSGSTINSQYSYTLDGTGVDIIVFDSGIEAEHPEFNDANGQSRVQKINWFDYAPELTPPDGFVSSYLYVDVDGHGTCCMSIAAGRVNGWAKNANLYSIKNSDLSSIPDRVHGLSLKNGEAVSAILGFHANKAADPVTGQRNPTIVNLSVGYVWYDTTAPLSFPTANITYRGDNSTVTALPERDMLVKDTETFKDFFASPALSNAATTYASGYRLYGAVTNKVPLVIESINSYIEQLIDAGIHVVIAAGNNYQKIDVPGGPDYDNKVTAQHGKVYYYNRGGSPRSPNAIIVGGIDAIPHSDSLDQKAVFSNYGPGVDIYAPAVLITAATSTINQHQKRVITTFPYSENNRYIQVASTGTSMSAPCVVGVASLFLQLNPNLTPAQLKQMLIKHAKPTILNTGNVNNYGDFSNFRSVNSPTEPLMLYNPFNAHEQEIPTGGIQISRSQNNN